MIANVFRYFLIIISTGCAAQTKILFVGNSLTYTNDLPSLVRSIAKADGVTLNADMIAFANYALEDHWNEKNVSGALEKTRYDFVIFQQGPSALQTSRQNLMEYTLRFSSLCQSRQAQMCLYAVWPSVERSFDFDNAILSYAMAADSSSSILLPAGEAWKQVLSKKKNFPLYSPDGFHPSIHGSYLAAMVIYATIFKKENLNFISQKHLPTKLISEAELTTMKQVVGSLQRK